MIKIMVRFFLITGAFSLFGQNFVQAQDANTKTSIVTEIDIKNYVAKANNSRIQYKEGTVLVFTDPSSFFIAGCGLASLVFLWLAYNAWTYDKKSFNKNFDKIISAGWGVSGAFLGGAAIKILLEKFSKNPIIILDKKGFIYNDKRVLEWADVTELSVIEEFAENLIDRKNYTFNFLGKDGKFLFGLNNGFMLPIEITGHLLRLVNYYRALTLAVPIESVKTERHLAYEQGMHGEVSIR